ncbi:MAG: sprT domain-containing protein, partial [Lutibacter sp.]|nr:sprT domain-containing protein [Lutibacter sp.]
MNFQHLMLPFLQPTIYPEELLPYLANYLKNPKASTGSDVNLTLALKQYDEMSGKSFIFELPLGSIFTFNNKSFKKGNKRRTRFECVELSSKKNYLFNQNAEVKVHQ